jgi:hypothetical protein
MKPGQDRVIGTPNRNELDGPTFERLGGGGRGFPDPSSPARRPTQPLV